MIEFDPTDRVPLWRYPMNKAILDASTLYYVREDVLPSYQGKWPGDFVILMTLTTVDLFSINGASLWQSEYEHV